LLNLVSNAVKYVHQGGEVRIWGYELHNPTHLPSTPINQDWQAKEKRSVVVEIEDNGVGISAADQQHLFQRFFRSDNPLSVEAGGTGLGLAITHSLVQLHKGQIGFWSVEGEGSCFWVRLPAPTTELLPEAYGEEQQVQQV
jgi:signal transduction histidine kinase